MRVPGGGRSGRRRFIFFLCPHLDPQRSRQNRLRVAPIFANVIEQTLNRRDSHSIATPSVPFGAHFSGVRATYNGKLDGPMRLMTCFIFVLQPRIMVSPQRWSRSQMGRRKCIRRPTPPTVVP